MQNDSNSNSSDEWTQPNIVDTADSVNNTSLNSLPEKSRKKYEVVYKRFMDWQSDNIVKSYAENVVIAYFEELSKKVKSSTLWSQYSMLRSTLTVKHDVDISEYLELRAFLKQQSAGYKPKLTKTLTSNEIHKFLNEAPNNKYLMTKVALIIGVTGACRREELCKMKIDDIEDLSSAVIIKIAGDKKKAQRLFTITGHFYEIYKKYAVLRPKDVFERRFFLNYQNGKCTKQVVGINKFGSMAKEIASYLNLPNPELYTGHCFRRCSTILVDAEHYSSMQYTRQPTHTTSAVANVYIGELISNNIEITNKMLKTAGTLKQIQNSASSENENLTQRTSTLNVFTRRDIGTQTDRLVTKEIGIQNTETINDDPCETVVPFSIKQEQDDENIEIHDSDISSEIMNKRIKLEPIDETYEQFCNFESVLVDDVKQESDDTDS